MLSITAARQRSRPRTPSARLRRCRYPPLRCDVECQINEVAAYGAPALTFRPPVERRSGYSNENPQGELAADGHARRIFSIGFPFASSSTSLSRRRIFGMRGSHCGRG
jgi:hypothetical protein